MLAQTFCSVFSLSIVLRKNFRMRNFHSWEFYNFSNISSWKRKSKQRPGLCCELALGESWNGGRFRTYQGAQNLCSRSSNFASLEVLSVCFQWRREEGRLCSCAAHRPRICLAWKFHISEGLRRRKILYTCVQNSGKPYTPVFRIPLCPCSRTWV